MRPFTIEQIDHLVLRVSDLERSIGFIVTCSAVRSVGFAKTWVWSTWPPVAR